MSYMMFLAFVVFLGVQRVNCAFFDLTDVDDPLSLLWHTKDSVIKPKTNDCWVQLPDSTDIKGECMHKTHCFLSGGQSHGQSSCGILSTCCTHQDTCLKWTKSKVSHFTSGLNTLNDCLYVVEVQNDNVCQVRLDFENFQLSGPESQALIGTDNRMRTSCTTDYMIVTPNTYNIPTFCGNNDGQHVYIHLNSHKKVELHVHLANRSNVPNAVNIITNPHWKIKVTQLECPGLQNLFTKHSSTTDKDFRILAPEGAIQYFTLPHGGVRSFGYDLLQNKFDYISGVHYGIAFKKRAQVTCMRFTVNSMYLRNQNAPAPADGVLCEDYLFVPELEATTIQQTSGSKVCPLNAPKSAIFSSNTSGPFYINFFSQSSFLNTENTGVHAFDLSYDLTTTC